MKQPFWKSTEKGEGQKWEDQVNLAIKASKKVEIPRVNSTYTSKGRREV